MNAEQKQFMEKASEAGAKAVAFAFERNFPLIIADIERNSGDEVEPELAVTIKLTVSHPASGVASIKVDEVCWKRQYKYTDRDFMPAEVNMQQPELALSTGATLAKDAADEDEKRLPLGKIHQASRRNLRKIADLLGLDIFKWCDWANVPHSERTILHYDHTTHKWHAALCADIDQAREVMNAADAANIALNDDLTLMPETANRLKKYVSIVDLDNDAPTKYDDAICQPLYPIMHA